MFNEDKNKVKLPVSTGEVICMLPPFIKSFNNAEASFFEFEQECGKISLTTVLPMDVLKSAGILDPMKFIGDKLKSELCGNITKGYIKGLSAHSISRTYSGTYSEKIKCAIDELNQLYPKYKNYKKCVIIKNNMANIVFDGIVYTPLELNETVKMVYHHDNIDFYIHYIGINDPEIADVIVFNYEGASLEYKDNSVEISISTSPDTGAPKMGAEMKLIINNDNDAIIIN